MFFYATTLCWMNKLVSSWIPQILLFSQVNLTTRYFRSLRSTISRSTTLGELSLQVTYLFNEYYIISKYSYVSRELWYCAWMMHTICDKFAVKNLHSHLALFLRDSGQTSAPHIFRLCVRRGNMAASIMGITWCWLRLALKSCVVLWRSISIGRVWHENMKISICFLGQPCIRGGYELCQIHTEFSLVMWETASSLREHSMDESSWVITPLQWVIPLFPNLYIKVSR